MGLLSHGFLWLVVATIAGSVGFGGGGGEASSTGAISQLSQESYGTVLLAVLAVGLAGYSLLRLLHTFTNPSDEDGLQGIGARISYFVRFLIYGGLTVYTVKQVFGSDSGGGGSESQLTQQLLDLPGGRILVAIVALVMLAIGIHQLYSAVTGDFMDQLKGASARQEQMAKIVGTVGHAARGIVFGTIGILFAQAALQSDSSQAGGVDKALQTISSSPVGTVALTLIAIGLACFGLFVIALATWGNARAAG